MRLNVSLSVSFSAFAGYVMYSGNFSDKLIWPVLGVFLLAAGTSALNQIQEKDFDKFMNRTKSRPLPAGKISLQMAYLFVFLFIIAGLTCLFFLSTSICFYLGLFNIAWYNLFYTYMKRSTAFAVVPGAITGVVPVLMGWTAAGGFIAAPMVIMISVFIFIWQIPHFWLLMMRYSEDYKSAGFPVLHSLFSFRQLRHIILSWMLAAGVYPLIFIFSGILFNQYLQFILLLLIISATSFQTVIFIKNRELNYKKAFILINIYMLLVVVVLLTGRLIS